MSEIQFQIEQRGDFESLLDREFREQIEDIGRRLELTFELLGTPATRKELRRQLTAALDGKLVVEDDDYDVIYSPPLAVTRQYFHMAESLFAKDDPKGEVARNLAVLLRLLGRTAEFLEDMSIEPTKEGDVYTPVRKVAKAVFDDYVKSPKFSKPLKDYVPDFGVGDASAVVEYKFADKDDEVKGAIDTLATDVHGYTGSEKWDTFIAVVFQTRAFVSQDRFQKMIEANQMDAPGWHFILQTGRGARKKKDK